MVLQTGYQSKRLSELVEDFPRGEIVSGAEYRMIKILEYARIIHRTVGLNPLLLDAVEKIRDSYSS